MTLTLLTFWLLIQGVTADVIEHAQAGAAAQKQGRYDVAIEQFGRVTQLQPDSASGHANLGDAYFQKGEYGAAIRELSHALQLNPNLMGTHQTLGVALLLEGNAEQALPHLEKARTPELIGLAYLQTGRYGSAILAIHAALERQPEDPDLLYYFGRATELAAKSTSEQAAKLPPDVKQPHSPDPPADVVLLQTALAKDPQNPELLVAFSRAASRSSHLAFDHLLQTAPDSARAHQVRAERLLQNGRGPEAEQEFADALRLKPFTIGVHLELGNALAARESWAAAAAEFQQEAQLQPASTEPLYRLGRVAFLARKPALAEQAWRRVIAMDPQSEAAVQARLGLAELYRAEGRN